MRVTNLIVPLSFELSAELGVTSGPGDTLVADASPERIFVRPLPS